MGLVVSCGFTLPNRIEISCVLYDIPALREYFSTVVHIGSRVSWIDPCLLVRRCAGLDSCGWTRWWLYCTYACIYLWSCSVPS